MLTVVIQNIWKNEIRPKDWKNAVMDVVVKGKAQIVECNNFRGIYLLVTAGKV